MQIERTTADGHLRPAAAYGRESEVDQGEYSPQYQREEATAILLRYGYYVAMWRYDAKQGDRISRAGYQEIAEAAKRGLIEAIGVCKMSRWGRNAAERLKIGEELDRLRVPVYDAQRGKADTPGLERVIYAGMDEQFLRDLSWTMVRAMPRAAKDGKHLGPTPIGYQRQVPQDRPYKPGEALDLVPDPVYAPVVVEIFERYAAGESTYALARRLNARPELPNPKSTRGVWTAVTIGAMLRRRVYAGEVEWGKRRDGKYNRYEGDVIEGPGRWPAIVERDVWQRVQQRLEGHAPPARTRTQRGDVPALLAGFLRCAGCGGPATGFRDGRRGTGMGPYRCDARRLGQAACPEPSVTRAVADAAVLREVARLQLRGRAWTAADLGALVPRDPHAAERRRLAAEIAQADAELQKGVAALRAVGDFSETVVAAFRADSQALAARIAAARAQLAALPEAPSSTEGARALHERLRTTDLAQLLWGLHAAGDTVALRALLGDLITRARLVERVRVGRSGRTVWARAELQWSADVRTLLDARVLLLGPEPEPPVAVTKREKAAERARRYRARRAAQQEGDPPQR